jgi:hypothetical protein
MPQHTFATGDLVILDPTWVQPRRPQLVYRVTKLAPVNLTATPVGTAGRPIKGDKDMFLPAPPDLAAAALAAEATAPAPFWPGTVVTVTGPRWSQPPEQLYVVLQLKDTTAAIARLGGDNGRLWPRMPLTALTAVAVPTALTGT